MVHLRVVLLTVDAHLDVDDWFIGSLRFNLFLFFDYTVLFVCISVKGINLVLFLICHFLAFLIGETEAAPLLMLVDAILVAAPQVDYHLLFFFALFHFFTM